MESKTDNADRLSIREPILFGNMELSGSFDDQSAMGTVDGCPLLPGEVWRHPLKSGQIVSMRNHPGIGLLCFGSASIYTADRNRRTHLKFLKQGEIFGAASLLLEGEIPTEIEADEPSLLLLISKAFVMRRIQLSPAFSIRYLMFLSDRVRFLNEKILTFTASDAMKKTIRYLLSSADPDGIVTIGSMSKLASTLSVGRASLYRITDTLVSEALIERSTEKIRILDRAGLKKKEAASDSSGTEEND